MSREGKLLFNRQLKLLRPEPGRARRALERDAATFADQVEAIGEGSVCTGYTVVYRVYDHRHPDLHTKGAGDGDVMALLIGGWIAHPDVHVPVDVQDPAFLRVRLADINDVERNTIAVSFPYLVQGS